MSDFVLMNIWWDTQVHVLHKFTVCPYLYILKGHAYDEVAGPVAAASESDGRRSRSLAEQFSYYEPWNGTGTNLKETHKEEDSRHADIAHPREITLEGRVHSVKAVSSSSSFFPPPCPICLISQHLASIFII